MARAKKTASASSTAPKTRGIDVQEVEARVTALDKAKRRSYDIFDIEQRVYDLEKNSGGGGGSNLTTLNATPTTSAQTITPESPYDGFDEVKISAVTSSIDANIAAGNIKKDVTILGVTGTYEGSGGGGDVQIIKKEISDSLSGSATITKTGTYHLWTDLTKTYLNNFAFKVNGADATTLIDAGFKSQDDPVGQGFGYSYYEFNLTAGDVFSWTASYNTRNFIMFG